MYRTYYACDFMIAINHLFVVTVWCYRESVHRDAGEKLCTCGLMQPVLWPTVTKYDSFDELAVDSVTFGISVDAACSIPNAKIAVIVVCILAVIPYRVHSDPNDHADAVLGTALLCTHFAKDDVADSQSAMVPHRPKQALVTGMHSWVQ